MNEDYIVAYPLNGIQYDATDAQTYLCTRTSGVYSSENHFKLGEVVGRQITIGSGIAWMKISEFGGIVFAVTEPVTVTVPGAGQTDRTDLIVLRYDKNNDNAREVVCKIGSNSVKQSDGVFELALYSIDVKADTTLITSSHIHDVRSTPLCGVMKDGVTGIPVETLVDNFESRLKDLLDDIDEKGQEKLHDFSIDTTAALSDFRAEGETAIGTINLNASNAITDFTTTSVQELNEFRTDAGNQLATNIQNNAAMIDVFKTEYEKAIDDANALFEATNADGQAIVDSLTEKNTEFGSALNRANSAIDSFVNTDAPNAITAFQEDARAAIDSFTSESGSSIDTFENNAQAAITDFQQSGRSSIDKFEDDSQAAIEGFEEDVANIAAGTDVMLQTAFNQSKKVGQVAFADETPIVLTGGFTKHLSYISTPNVFAAPFASSDRKKKLREYIRNNRSITIRLFSAKQSGEKTSADEWNNVVAFLNDQGGTFEDVFDTDKPCYDFHFQYADTINDRPGGNAYFTCIFDDLQTAVMSIPITGLGSGGTLSFI